MTNLRQFNLCVNYLANLLVTKPLRAKYSKVVSARNEPLSFCRDKNEDSLPLSVTTYLRKTVGELVANEIL